MISFQSPSSIAFSINGFNVYYYGICMSLALLCGFSLSYLIAKKFYKSMDADVLYDVVTVGLLIGFLCARIYYCILNFDFYSANPDEILNFREGGISIQGGILGGFLFGAIYAKLKKLPILILADIASYGMILAQAIGRWGNFFNSEAYGHPTNTFGVFIPVSARVQGYEQFSYFQPTFLYESFLNLIVLAILFFVVRKLKFRFDGLIFASYVILYSIVRLIIEPMRLDSALNIGSIHIATIASLVMITLAMIFSVILYKKTKSNS